MKKLLMTASTFSHFRNFHVPYLEAFREAGWQVDVAAGGKADGSLPAREYELPLEKKMLSANNLKTLRMLIKMLRRGGYDLVITHTSLAAFYTRLAVMLSGKRPKVINVAHGYLFDENTGRKKALALKGAEYLVSPVTDLVLTMNRWDFEWAKSHRTGKRVALIPGMGVDPARGDRTGETVALPFADTDFVLVYPAEFSERKNQRVLLEAMVKAGPMVKLVLAGNGSTLEECKALAGQLGVAERVFFPGYVKNIAGLFKQCSGAVSSSRSEGLPFNIMEAMTEGLPVIASRVKGNEDLVTDGVTGYLIEAGDVKAYAAAMTKLAESPATVAEMGAQGKKQIEQYCLEHVLPKVMHEYMSVL